MNRVLLRQYIPGMILVMLVLSGHGLGEEKNGRTLFGVHAMAGGRYDDMRMCVASPAGSKGGPIADIMLDIKFPVKDNATLAVNIPFMRPLLFAAAFSMLQFEPQLTLELSRQINNTADFVLGPGVGVSFHYGPDYRSDNDNRGESFFAAGPLISNLFGVQFARDSGRKQMVGLRPFYVALFSGESPLSPGTVAGATLEWYITF